MPDAHPEAESDITHRGRLRSADPQAFRLPLFLVMSRVDQRLGTLGTRDQGADPDLGPDFDRTAELEHAISDRAPPRSFGHRPQERDQRVVLIRSAGMAPAYDLIAWLADPTATALRESADG